LFKQLKYIAKSHFYAGPTSSGKTVLTKKLINAANHMISPPPEEIVYNYSVYQPIYDEMRGNIVFSEGITPIDEIPRDLKHRLWVLDDQLYTAQDSQQIVDTFIKYSHHLNISIILLTQNLFSQGKHFRTISLNTQYMFLLKSARDRSTVQSLARQIYPENVKFLSECYADAVSKPYGFLFIDLKPQTSDLYRVKSDIFSDFPIVYIKQ
jgi:hypothetical protein